MPKTTTPTAYANIPTICGIAAIIEENWGTRNVNFAARPYLNAMYRLSKITDTYGMDSAKSIVTYFLCNCSQWKGPVAREIKNELKRRTK